MPRKSFGRPWCLGIGIVIAIVIIIVLVVPLAVILPRRNRPQNISILFPLYVYPETNDSWSPLFDELATYPDLNFTIIVNPSSGPGNSSYPSDEYVSQVEQLNSYPNVRTVGYVRTGYTTRNITSVLQDVATYSGWTSRSPTLAMDGIFFDEMPSEYSPSMADYITTINAAVKSASGLQLDRTIIHNPGAIPDSRYSDSSTDITVVFEDTYQAYQAKEANLAALPQNRTAYSYMLNSVPAMSNSSLQSFVDNLSQRAEYLFLTTLSENFYESFGPNLAELCAVAPT